MKHLVLFGDSLFAQMSKGQVRALEEKLDNMYEVHNFAIGGFNTNDTLAQTSFILDLPIDVIAISLGINDSKPWAQVPLVEFKQNVQKLMAVFGADKVVWLLPPPIDEGRLTEKHANISNKIISIYSTETKKILQKNHARFIDSETVLQKLTGKGIDYHVEDGVHLNDAAYNVIIQELKTLLHE